MPIDMGGSEEKARMHFKRSVELSKGMSTSPYLGLASAVSVKNKNIKEFKELLGNVLDIDVDIVPRMRLANIIDQRKARWMLEHIDNYFLLNEEGEEEE